MNKNFTSLPKKFHWSNGGKQCRTHMQNPRPAPGTVSLSMHQTAHHNRDRESNAVARAAASLGPKPLYSSNCIAEAVVSPRFHASTSNGDRVRIIMGSAMDEGPQHMHSSASPP